MNEAQSRAYVEASAQLMELKLDEARVRRVAAYLQRTAQMAQILDAWPLAEDDELAEIYAPKRHEPIQNERDQL